MRPLRLLHLEDSRVDAELVRELIASHGIVADIDQVETREQFVAALERGGYDLILADYALPAFDGMTALELARAKLPDTPLLFVTGALKDDSAVETLRRGATDFIVKQRLVRLVPSIQRALRERDERTQRARAETALKFLASASARLASSLDIQAIIGNLARLSVPALADFCLVDMTTHDGDRDQVAAVHVEARDVELVERLRLRRQLPTGVAEIYDDMTEERLGQLATNREQLAILRALAPRSVMLVPMVVGGRTIGIITFGFSSSRRCHDGRDLATAQNLAERAAVSVENARLYREVVREVRSRTDLIATVSHDLRNPLQSIVLTATVLDQQLAPGDPMRARVESITKSAELATRLLDDLLDLARFDAGSFILERAVHDIGRAVTDSIELVAGLAERKQIRLVNAVRPGVMTAYCDLTRTGQVIGNLLGNALKFTPHGGTISVAARELLARDAIEISVSDTGAGIRAHDLPLLFERYWQGGNGRGGVGLGLSIVKALVELQGGTVSVASVPGAGSTFSFTLPTKPPAVTTGARATVLVVDDDDETRIAVAQVLDEAGYHTLTAGNGVEALELLHREPRLHPSVILLDLKMPKMDARAFLREQTRDPQLKDIAVIVFSGDDDVAAVAEELNVSGHLRKPLGAKDLIAAVAGARPGATPSRSAPPH